MPVYSADSRSPLLYDTITGALVGYTDNTGVDRDMAGVAIDPAADAPRTLLALSDAGLTKGGAALTSSQAAVMRAGIDVADGTVGVAPTRPAAFDYYIDDALGNDANEGNAAAPWASLSKINTAIASTQTRTVLVRAGTYDKADDAINVTLVGASIDTRLDIWFEPGCIMDGTAVADNTSAFELAGGGWTAVVYGNGLRVQNYADVSTGTSPNGFGTRGTAIAYGLDIHISGCDDAFSAHDQSTMILHRCTGVNGEKSAFANVNTAYVEYHNCEFSVAGTANGSTGVTKLFGTKIIPTADGVALVFADYTYFDDECQIGTATKRVQLINATAGKKIYVNNSFVNVYMDGTTFAELYRCYGKLTTRQRNADGTGIGVDKCVFVGPASGTGIPSSTVHGANADFTGTISPIRITNTVLKGFTTAIGGEMTLTRAEKYVSGGSYARNNCFNSNTTNVDADLTTAGADITGSLIADPLLRSASGYRQEDYATDVGSPCIALGIGFSLSDIA